MSYPGDKSLNLRKIKHCPPYLLPFPQPQTTSNNMDNCWKKYCSVDGCQETTCLHRFPNNIYIRDQWLMFIHSEIPQQFSST